MSLAQTTVPQPLKKTQNFRLKYKTEKCRYLQQKGFCPYSHTCTFAHFDHEMRGRPDVPPNYRTKPCINFTNKGFCTYGERCQYLHLPARPDDDGQKTRSSSEESASSRDSHRHAPTPSPLRLWERLSHHRRVQVIQELGLDFAVRQRLAYSRSSSRLMQLLSSNQKQSEYSTDEEAEQDPELRQTRKEKKYSM